MGYYKENLKKFDATGLRIWEILTSKEVECAAEHFGVNLTDEQFELVTYFVYGWVMSVASVMPSEITELFFTALKNGEFTLKELDTYEGLLKVTDLLNSKI